MGWLHVLSDIFSVITIALCLILKVPQIFRLIKCGDASGLSFKALLLELSSYTVTMMYNYTNRYSILSYMEYPIIIIQEYVLIGLVMRYQKFNSLAFPLLLLFYGSISFAFAFRILDKFILTLLLPFTTPVSAASKIMQLVEIVSKKDATCVSILTWVLSVFTNATRIFTIYMDSGDLMLITNMTVSAFLSSSVMFAAIYYQKIKPPIQKKAE